jgi:hypothetical protein
MTTWNHSAHEKAYQAILSKSMQDIPLVNGDILPLNM